MNRRELLAAMTAAAAAPVLANPLLPPAMEEMVEIQLSLTPHMIESIKELAADWGVSEDEVIAQCLRDMIEARP